MRRDPLIERVRTTLTDLFFPPRCAACGELLPPLLARRCETVPAALCVNCLPEWEQARGQADALVLSQAENCLPSAAWLVPYCPEEPEAVTQRVIFRLKHRDDRRLTAWLAAWLADPVHRTLIQAGVDARTVICLYPPRRRAAIKQDGFDQAERLACGLARQLGAICLPAVRRISDGSGAQKSLDAAARRVNAVSAYALDESFIPRLTGRYVVLVDDLLTTGATLLRIASLAQSAGVSGVLFATVARTRSLLHGRRETV